MTPHKTAQFEEIENKILHIASQRDADRIFILTDSHVERFLNGFMPRCPRLVVEAGEESKSLAGAVKVWEFLEREGALRRSMLVNVGGGMVSDLGGFAASTFKRGIGCVNVPTTLLAAVDAAIGGKTGINFAWLKNEVGTFSLPLGVFPMTSLFTHLPEDEWLSGVGEAIKTGMLEGPDLYRMATSREFVKERRPDVVDEVVARCAAFKQKIVSEDFREGGKRKILNLGHTAGHGIEAWAMAHGRPIPHGIAVAYGLKFALEKSRREEGLDEAFVEDYERILAAWFPALTLTSSDMEEIECYMSHDKKNTVAGRPAWVLLRACGVPAL